MFNVFKLMFIPSPIDFDYWLFQLNQIVILIELTYLKKSNTTRAARAAQGCTDDGVRVMDTGTLRE